MDEISLKENTGNIDNTKQPVKEALVLETADHSIPLYYGWFLSFEHSANVRNSGFQVINSWLDLQDFFNDSALRFDKGDSDLRSLYFTTESLGDDDKVIHHITACFLDKGRKPWSKDYMCHSRANEALGRVAEIEIVGWFLTPRTIGARIRLSPKELMLWGKNDSFLKRESRSYLDPMVPEDLRSSIGAASSEDVKQDGIEVLGSNGVPSIEAVHQEGITAVEATVCSSSEFNPRSSIAESVFKDSTDPVRAMKSFYSSLGSEFSHPSFSKGCTAHITLGCRDGIHAKQTGYDLKQIIASELLREPSFEIDFCEDYKLRNYGLGQWVCYLCSPIKMYVTFNRKYDY